jgi:UPF0176 protein
MSLDLKARRCLKGSSDPVGLTCTCTEGTILLFYKYATILDPEATAKNLQTLCLGLNLRGKLRISTEGINISVGGSVLSIIDFRARIVPLLDILHEIDSNDDSFFKPGNGCIHCFDDLSIKVVNEICPFGSSPSSMRSLRPNAITGLSPSDFHNELSKQNSDTLVLDVRNYYESRIGYFDDAIMPAIRRFSSLKEWVDANVDKLENKKIFTYCTGYA